MKPPGFNFIAMTRYQLGLILIGILIWGCSEDEAYVSVDPEQMSLTFEQEFVIEEDAESPEFFFQHPVNIRTDRQGNIYVADNGASVVWVFDDHGTFLRSIGEPGRGPGELSSITAIDINDRDELVVLDRGNNRLSGFSGTGNLLWENVYDAEILGVSMKTGDFRWLSNGHSVLTYKQVHATALADDMLFMQQPEILHIYDNSFEQRIASMGEIDRLVDVREVLARYFVSGLKPGFFRFLENDRLWYVSGIYDGRIHQFEYLNQQWEHTASFSGHLYPEEPFTMMDPGGSPLDGAFGYSTFINGTQQIYAGRVNSESHRLFQLRDKRVVHFSHQYIDDAQMLVLEIFDEEGNLQGIGKMNFLDYFGESPVEIRDVIWKDYEDRFLFLYYDDGLPKIRVGTIAGL